MKSQNVINAAFTDTGYTSTLNMFSSWSSITTPLLWFHQLSTCNLYKIKIFKQNINSFKSLSNIQLYNWINFKL